MYDGLVEGGLTLSKNDYSLSLLDEVNPDGHLQLILILHD